MAKKSRRQKLPTEKDFERLKAPKPARPEPVEEQVPVDELDFEEDVPVAQDVERDVGTNVGDAAAAEAGEPIETTPIYNVDGGMSVSLAGDVTGQRAPDEIAEENIPEEHDELMTDVADEGGSESACAEVSEVDSGQSEAITDEGGPVEDVPSPGDSALDDPDSEDRHAVEETFVGRGTDVGDDEEGLEDEHDEPDDEAPRPPEVLILVGSPHTDGKSALFGRKLSEYLRLSGAAVTLYEIAKYPVAACTGCEACSRTGLCCIKGDAWNVLSRHMESCAALVVVAPVYFAGPSGWLKAALDRCQMYWARKYVLKDRIPRKRPAHLVVIGDGGDPYGTEPLETICTSALNCANLRIEPDRIMRMIGDQYDLRNAITLSGRVMASIGRM